jgi:hypothetical protein
MPARPPSAARPAVLLFHSAFSALCAAFFARTCPLPSCTAAPQGCRASSHCLNLRLLSSLAGGAAAEACVAQPQDGAAPAAVSGNARAERGVRVQRGTCGWCWSQRGLLVQAPDRAAPAAMPAGTWRAGSRRRALRWLGHGLAVAVSSAGSAQQLRLKSARPPLQLQLCRCSSRAAEGDCAALPGAGSA